MEKQPEQQAAGGEKKKLTAKEQRILERQQKEKEQAAAKAKDGDGPKANSSEQFGVFPMNQSQARAGKHFTKVADLDEKKATQHVLIRARVYNVRAVSANLCFLVLRQEIATVQAIVSKGDTSKDMVAFVQKLSRESIVDVEGVVSVPKEPVTATTQKTVEVQVKKLHVVSAAAPSLPLLLEDASRPQPLLDEQDAAIREIDARIAKSVESLAAVKDDKDAAAKLQAELETLQKQKGEALKFPNPDLSVRLNNRVIDLRTQTNHAIFRIQSGVCALFREFLGSHGFMEIHTPKMIGAASEGGANVFKIQYFDTNAYLAQSPQLYKQMMICSDFERVFEIGPVFRAENANTNRHLTEFTGLDMEMAFNEHYHEVLDVMDGMFLHIFDGIQQRFAKELDIINIQYPFTPIKYNRPTLRLKFSEGVQMLQAAGSTTAQPLEDLSTPDEKLLGKLVKEKYGVDFYVLDKFPANARPFYTMPDPEDPRYTNSYDLFVRGEEIVSGSQRVHDAAVLEEKAKAKGVTISMIQPYIDAFKFGAPPHGGCGVGLERLVMLYLGLGNIRRSSLFPRDPSRLAP